MHKSLAVILLVAAPMAFAADPPPNQGEETRGFSSVLIDALRGLSGILPQPNAAEDAKARQVATMGIRGAESTGTLIEPYWKGDDATDGFAAQAAELTEVLRLLQAKQFAEAHASARQFLTSHPQSDLLPAARFSLGLALAGEQRLSEARSELQGVANDYPKHPLAEKALRVAAAL